jgi:hypothetical protein
MISPSFLIDDFGHPAWAANSGSQDMFPWLNVIGVVNIPASAAIFMVTSGAVIVVVSGAPAAEACAAKIQRHTNGAKMHLINLFIVPSHYSLFPLTLMI